MTKKSRVVIAGLGDTGVLMATRLSATCDVVGITTKPLLLSGQELGGRLTNLEAWRSSYMVDYKNLKKLDAVRILHGAITSVDFEAQTVVVNLASGEQVEQEYDVLVLATGASNGFWRTDNVLSKSAIEAQMSSINEVVSSHNHVAIIGGGATGVSVADNLARRGKNVDLYFSGEYPLQGFHPRAQRWAGRVLARDGVALHPRHRAVVPADLGRAQLKPGVLEWSSGQAPVASECTLWAVGHVVPHTRFLPASVLDEEGFVRVDQNLRVPGYSNVYAVGDVAASDPLRSSARNWGWEIVVANIGRSASGKKLKQFRAPKHQWGSVFGLQPNGLIVVQPNGLRMRFPAVVAKPFLYRFFIRRYLYGGARSEA